MLGHPVLYQKKTLTLMKENISLFDNSRGLNPEPPIATFHNFLKIGT